MNNGLVNIHLLYEGGLSIYFSEKFIGSDWVQLAISTTTKNNIILILPLWLGINWLV